jgi:glycosyltransferase involved in cell wall biosynthesis
VLEERRASAHVGVSRPEDGVLGAGRSVAILTAHHRRPELLVKAIDSVLEQSWSDWQLVIVDDDSGTPAELEQIRRRYIDPRIMWLGTNRNVGPFRIYNRLLPAIASPFIVLQDADDRSHPERLVKLLNAFRDRSVDVLGSAITKVDLQSNSLGEAHLPDDVNHALRWRRRGGVVFGATLAMRTEFLRQIGGFDGATRMGADSDLVCRAVFAGRVANLDEALVQTTVWDGSLTGSPATGFHSQARARYRRRLARRFYSNLLRHWLGLLRPVHLRAHANDIPFGLFRPNGSAWPE